MDSFAKTICTMIFFGIFSVPVAIVFFRSLKDKLQEHHLVITILLYGSFLISSGLYLADLQRIFFGQAAAALCSGWILFLLYRLILVLFTVLRKGFSSWMRDLSDDEIFGHALMLLLVVSMAVFSLREDRVKLGNQNQASLSTNSKQ